MKDERRVRRTFLLVDASFWYSRSSASFLREISSPRGCKKSRPYCCSLAPSCWIVGSEGPAFLHITITADRRGRRRQTGPEPKKCKGRSAVSPPPPPPQKREEIEIEAKPRRRLRRSHRLPGGAGIEMEFHFHARHHSA